MRTALVTGAAGGIGEAICKVFSVAGYTVIGVDRRKVKPEPSYSLLHFDISQLRHDTPERTEFYQCVEELCSGRLDALVNNAAIQIVKPIEQIVPADWDETLDTNLLAPFWLIQRFLPALRAVRGSVINIASIHAVATKAEFTTYATSKGALVTLTRVLAIELAPKVRVNAVLPAATDTPMLRAGFDDNLAGLQALGAYHPLGRIARPEEVAQVALFLASPQASFVTGATYRVDGGIGSCLHDPVVAR
jgi:NAD(P)-dependent dehydrogenase (short-subunit alcohol dehydrogenase family)